MSRGFLQDSCTTKQQLVNSAFQLLCVQNHWLVYGGQTYEEDETTLFTFDFQTRLWSTAEVTGKPHKGRNDYLATCHDNAMVILGGTDSAYV